MISLIQLEYLVAVDTYRHFATAAEKCFVTQPTLSMQIKKLEEDLDLLIFDRSKQPVVPTLSGQRIIDQARKVLQESKRIEQIVQEERNCMKGELRIGIIPTIAPYLLPLFTGRIKQAYPDLQLNVQEEVTEEIIQKLKYDLLDVGILVTPLNESGIFEHPLYYEEMQVYANKDHELLKAKSIQAKNMDLSDMWLLNDGHCFKHQVVNLCQVHERKTTGLPFEFLGGSIDTLLKIIDKDGGYTLIPEMAALELEYKSKQIKHFDGITPLREVALVFTRKFEKAKLIDKLAEQIKVSIPKQLLDKDRGSIVEWR